VTRSGGPQLRISGGPQRGNPAVADRARQYLAIAKAGQAFPRSVSLPVGSLRIGNDFILYAAGGEITTDYALRLKRESPVPDPWLIGYAYEVPSYIPSARLLKEGGYEAGDTSLKGLGLYGRYNPSIEDIIVEALVGQ
jgi:neutral ceramidase